MARLFMTTALGLLLVAACVKAAPVAEAQPNTQPEITDMLLESPAFANGEPIPTKHTCEGEDISPALDWSNLPVGTRSLALIVDDPDAPDPKAPKRTWVHWVVYELPADTSGLPEGVAELPAGAREGLNDWHSAGYRGPCPPIGEHRYFHKLYALDAPLGDLSEPTKAELEQAMTGHILAEAQLVGTYEKRHDK